MDEILKQNSMVSLEEFIESLPLGILVFNENGIVTTVNNNLFYFGLDEINKEKLTGKNISDLEFIRKFKIDSELDSLKENIPFEKELKSVETLEGGSVNIIIKGTPLLSEANYKGGVLLIEDMNLGINLQKEKTFSSSYFNKFISALFDCYLLVNPSGTIMASSRAEILSRHPMIGIDKQGKLIFENVQEGFDNAELIKNMLNEKKTIKTEANYRTDENERIYQVIYIPFTEVNDSVEFILIVLKDVTNESEKESELNQELNELKRYEDISNAITDAIINIDLNGNISYWNDAATDLFGLSRSEVFGKFIGRAIPSIDEKYFGILKNELQENRSWKGEFWTSEKNKEADLLAVRMALIEADNYIVILCNSITERAIIEKQLRVSEERYRNIVTNTREFICTFEAEGNITYVNPFFVKEFGYSEDELLNMNLKDLLDPVQFDREDSEFESLYQDDAESIELTLLKKDQSSVYVLANFTASKDLSGRVANYNAIFTDITEKKRAEKDLLMIRTVFEASQDGIAIQSGRKYILVNDRFVQMFGYNSIEDVVGNDLLDFVSEEDVEKVAGIIESFEQGEEVDNRYVYIAKRKDGSVFHVEKSTSSYETADGVFIVSTYRDITKEKQAIDDLEVSEERYRSITENINDCVWSAESKQGKLQMVFYSEVITKITGYASETFLEDNRLWLRIIHPNDAKSVVSRLRSFYADNVRNSTELEYRIINNLGNIVWIKNKINVLRNKEGIIEKVFGLASDITLSKRAEEELKKSANELKVLNETKDRFISIISHDLRTPFSSILGFTDMLLSDRNMTEDKQIQYIGFIQESSRNMLSLVNSLLDWTRLQTGRMHFEPQRINAKYVVTKAIQVLSGSALQKNINLVSDLVNDVYIHADENLLFQVFNNLISNAIKFTQQEGNITVSAQPLVKQRLMQFKVRDTGIGIKEEDIHKLFKVDTKYTTPGTSGEKGSGLGLSLCYDIVKKHGGDIAVRSEYGVGTEFIFTIPISSTTILLVDDSKNDRILYTKLLKNFIPNYNVDEASNGKEAYDKIRATTPALVITDHDMPTMSGYSLVQQLNLSDMKYRPPVIILSSDLTDSIIKDYKELGVEYAFKKPVNLTAFKFAVEKSLKKSLIS